MRGTLVAAACLTVLLALAHSYLGERYILTRLFRRGDLPKLLGGTEFTRSTLRFAWHITSIAWLGLAALVGTRAFSSELAGRTQAGIIACVFGVSGVVALAASRGRHLSWPVFLTIAALVWIGYQ